MEWQEGNKQRPNCWQWCQSFILGDSKWKFVQVGYPVHLLSPSVICFCVGQQKFSKIIWSCLSASRTLIHSWINVWCAVFCACVTFNILQSYHIVNTIILNSCFYQHYSAYCETSILFQLLKQNFVTVFEMAKTKTKRERREGKKRKKKTP